MKILEFLSLPKEELGKLIETKEKEILDIYDSPTRVSQGDMRTEMRKIFGFKVYRGESIVKGLRNDICFDHFSCAPGFESGDDKIHIHFIFECTSWASGNIMDWDSIALTFHYSNGNIIDCSGRLGMGFPMTQFSEPREYIQLRYGLDNCG